MPEVTAVIVNYRTPDLTMGAVRSCLSEPEIEEVIVIDNGSGDDSADKLTEAFRGTKARVLENDQNLGFAFANNKGMSRAHTDYVFLLNSDAFVLEGCVGTLLAKLKDDPGIGIIGPEILESDAKTPQPLNYGPFPSLRTIFLRDRSVPDPNYPDWISGVAMMMPRAFAKELDGFDDEYFMYFEDVDLCHRAKEAGKKIAREPTAKVVHFGGRSLRSDFRRKQMYYKSQDRYLEMAGISGFGRSMVQVARWPAYLASKLFHS